MGGQGEESKGIIGDVRKDKDTDKGEHQDARHNHTPRHPKTQARERTPSLCTSALHSPSVPALSSYQYSLLLLVVLVLRMPLWLPHGHCQHPTLCRVTRS